jgi:hypothetical protein
VIHPHSLLAALVLSMACSSLTAAEPPAKDRAIAKEPTYETKAPRYCQLVFGPEAKQSVWLVIDGEHLFVDRNGSGDLTSEGKRLVRRPAFLGGGFVVPQLAIADGKTVYENLIIYWTPPSPDQPKERFTVEVMVNVNKLYCQWAVFEATARTAKDAPVIHFGGPLEMVLLADDAPLPAAGRDRAIGAVIGTRSPTRHWAMVRNDRNLSPKADIHPIAEVTFPGQVGANPVRVKINLDQRCCNVRFFSTLRTPPEIGPGKAKVVLSFPAWTDMSVASAIRELRVEDTVPLGK